jgi:hypothetical protein
MAPNLEPAEIVLMTKQWIEAKRAGQELTYKLNPPDAQPVKVQIIGGLPDLRVGPDEPTVLMPHNGVHVEGHMIAGQPSVPKSNFTCNSVPETNSTNDLGALALGKKSPNVAAATDRTLNYESLLKDVRWLDTGIQTGLFLVIRTVVRRVLAIAGLKKSWT